MDIGYRESRLASLRMRGAWARGSAIAYAVVLTPVVIGQAYLAYVETRLDFDLKTLGLVGLVNLLSVAIFFISAVLLLAWIFRARKNLREFGAEELAYSPGWAVGCYFVPFANLVVPFRSMRELWNRSNGEDAYQASLTVPEVSAWWTCFMAGNFIGVVQLAMFVVQSRSNIIFVTPPGVNLALGAFANLLMIGSAIYLFHIIGAITRSQNAWKGVSQLFA